MRKTLFLLLSMAFSLLTYAQFSGSGSGTSADPYKIYNPQHLDDVRNFLNQTGVYFKLMSDVDLSEYLSPDNLPDGWQALGATSEPFKGIFDGNGKTICGFRSAMKTSYNGLFGVTDGATIKNFTLEGSTFSGGQYSGVLVGKASGSTISGVTVKMTGNLSRQGSTFGGFAGYVLANSEISNCSVSFNTTTGTYTQCGGFVGNAENSSFTSCATSGSVGNSTVPSYIGGFVGQTSASTYTGCTHEGTVQGYNYSGGFVGSVTGSSASSFSNCKTNGDCNFVSGSSCGGFVGYEKCSALCTFDHCYAIGDVTAKEIVGGFGGYVTYSSIINCSHHGNVVATGDYVGGLVAKMYPYGSCAISNSYCVGNVSTNGSNVGGVAGYISGAIPTIKDAKTISTLSSSYYPGKTYNGEKIVELSPNNGNYIVKTVPSEFEISLRVSDNDYLVGSVTNIKGYKIVGKSSIIDRYWKLSDDQITTTTSTSGYKYLYACIPNRGDITISDNYFSGRLSGGSNVGGIVGYANNIQSLDIIRNYSYGNVSGTDYVGGILGKESYIVSATVKGNLAMNSYISSVGSNVGRIYGSISSTTTMGASGTSERNYGLATCKISVNGVDKEYTAATLQHGDSRGNVQLKSQSTYAGLSWDFSANWAIDETKSYPYKKSQTIPPIITSATSSGATSISGNSVSGATVYAYAGGKTYSTTCSGSTWTINLDKALTSGEEIYVYTKESNLDQSYRVNSTVTYPGSGTEDDPYLIYTASDLANINSADYYKLMNDIDLTNYISDNGGSKGWEPVGRSAATMKGLDGDGHAITGLWINSTEAYTGLFATLSDATVKNLTIRVASDKKVTGGDYTGILTGKLAGGNITNVTVEGNLSGKQYVGALVGKNDAPASITNAQFNGNVEGTQYVGGLVGESNGITLIISHSFVVGNITATTGIAGGVYGRGALKCNNCFFEGIVSAADCAGGIAGSVAGSISGCKTSGSVKATGDTSYAGGIAGRLSQPNCIITDSYSTADVSATKYAGGISGYNKGSITYCYALGNITATECGGGIVAFNDGESAVTSNCFAANLKIDVAASGNASRVVGDFSASAPEPTMTNYARKSMVVSKNGVAQTIYDDPLQGKAINDADFMESSTYTNNGWDFTETWTIQSDGQYPELKWLAQEEECDFVLGDTNYDNQVDVTDYVAVGNYILGNTPASFNMEAADVNTDNQINVQDYVGVANIILYDNPFGQSGKQSVKALHAEEGYYAMNMWSADGLSWKVSLDNSDAICAMQMDVELPVGVGIEAATLSSRAKKSHAVTFRQKDVNTWTILVASMRNDGFWGNEGEVLELRLTPSQENGEIRLSDILLSDNRMNGHSVQDVVVSGVATGIATIGQNEAERDIYTLQGMKVTTNKVLKPGVYVVDGKKVMIK